MQDDRQQVRGSFGKSPAVGGSRMGLRTNTPERTNRIALPDGRSLGYARFGVEGGAPVFFFHGFPASRVEGELWDGAACRAGVSLVAPERPGFGLSDFQKDRALLDWPGDVAALAHALALDRFWVLGMSAGGPYALACAHQLRESVAGAATVSGLGPTTERQAIKEMGGLARGAFVLARHAPPAFRLIYGALAKRVAQDPDLNYRLNEAAPPDQEVLAQPELRDTINASISEAFRSGTAGTVHELWLLAQRWRFAAEEIEAPVHLWHGLEDGVTPHAMSELLAGKLPGARLRLIEGEGHLSLPIRHGGDILEALISSGRRGQ
jgi:pimeloyl-ACP methyl ester carboxylesterase